MTNFSKWFKLALLSMLAMVFGMALVNQARAQSTPSIPTATFVNNLSIEGGVYFHENTANGLAAGSTMNTTAGVNGGPATLNVGGNLQTTSDLIGYNVIWAQTGQNIGTVANDAQTTARQALTAANNAGAAAREAQAGVVTTHALAVRAQSSADAASVASENAFTAANQAKAASATTNSNLLLTQEDLNRTKATIGGFQSQINSLSDRVDQLATQANKGISAAMAMAGMAPPAHNARAAVAVGIGSYGGQSSLAVGVVARLSDRINAKLAVTTNGGVSAGVSFSFG